MNRTRKFIGIFIIVFSVGLISCNEADKTKTDEIFKTETTKLKKVGDSLESRLNKFSDSVESKLKTVGDSAKKRITGYKDSLYNKTIDNIADKLKKRPKAK